MTHWAPVIIFVGGAVNYYLVNGRWALEDPSQIAEATIRWLAIFDVVRVTLVYGTSSWLLVASSQTPVTTRAFVSAVVLLLLVLECAIRWWGAAAGELYPRLADALGLGIRGFGLFPIWPFLIGATVSALWVYWRGR
jgi:hypothetical protein